MIEVGIDFDNYYIVGGFRLKESFEKGAKSQPFPYLGRIDPDDRILEYNLSGTSLLTLPQNSPAYNSIKVIMRKAGY
jgi:hypothetical protein